MKDRVGLIRNLAFSGTSRDTLVLFLGNAVSSGLAIVFSVLAARFLGPEEFGIAAALVSFVAIVAAVGDFGLGASLFKFISKHYSQGSYKEAKNYLETIFSLRLLSAFLILVVLTALSPFLAKTLFKVDNFLLVVLSGIAVLGSILIDFQIQTFQSKKDFKLSSVFISLTNAIRVIFVVILIIGGRLTLLSGVFVFTIAPAVSFLVSILFQKTVFGFSGNSRRIIREVAKFSGLMGVNRIVSAINGRVDVLLLIHLLTPVETGVYSAAKQLAWGIPIFIGSFATVLAPRFATLSQEKLKKYFYKTIVLSVLICSLLLVGILIAPVIILLMGQKYQASVNVFRMLLVSFIPFVLSTPAVNLLIYGFGKPQVVVITSIISMPFVFLGSILLALVIGVYAPVAVYFIGNIFVLLMTYFYSYKYFKRI